MVLREGRLVSSYSQIDKYLQCPTNWEFKYIDGINFEIKSKHLEYGLAVHETLEAIFDYLKGGNFMDFNMSAYYKEMFTTLIDCREVPFDSEQEKEEWINCGLEMIDSLLNQGSEFEKMLMNSEILGVELPFEVPIEIMPIEIEDEETGETNTFDTVYIIGFIDLVLKTPDGIVIIDHKSGGKKFAKGKLRTNLQMPIYAMAIKELYGELPVKAYYNFTRIHEVQEVIIVENVLPEMELAMDKRGAKEIYCLSPDDAEREIRHVFFKMNSGNHNANPTPLCYWCDFSGICAKASKWKPKKST